VENISIPCGQADSAAAASLFLAPLADVLVQNAYSTAKSNYAALGDSPGDPPYAEGQKALNAMIASIQAFATAQGFPACPP
jgi:hypothetical protein